MISFVENLKEDVCFYYLAFLLLNLRGAGWP